jgi:hypothetical protein
MMPIFSQVLMLLLLLSKILIVWSTNSRLGEAMLEVLQRKIAPAKAV